MQYKATNNKGASSRAKRMESDLNHLCHPRQTTIKALGAGSAGQYEAMNNEGATSRAKRMESDLNHLCHPRQTTIKALGAGSAGLKQHGIAFQRAWNKEGG